MAMKSFSYQSAKQRSIMLSYSGRVRARGVLMLNYEYPPLGGSGSSACKYILKEFAKRN